MYFELSLALTHSLIHSLRRMLLYVGSGGMRCMPEPIGQLYIVQATCQWSMYSDTLTKHIESLAHREDTLNATFNPC